MRYLSLLITVPIALVALSFSVSNRVAVTFGLWPLPFTVEAPAFVAVLGALVAGFVGGGAAIWLSQGRYRRRARLEAARASRLEADLAAADARLRQTEERTQAAEAKLDELSRQVQATNAKAGLAQDGAPAALPTMH